MSTFAVKGKYSFEDFSVKGFKSSSVIDNEIPAIIRDVQNKYNYTVDPHTACAFKDLCPSEKYIVLATAHPAKFPKVFEEARLNIPQNDVLEALKEKEDH